jgi:ribosomal protein S18 acetylase RimI-like enzyme
MPLDLVVRIAEQTDLPALEWEGQYLHFRRLFRDVYQQMELGRTIIWIAEIPDEGMIGQLFISLDSHRPELADGKARAYLFGFRVKPGYRNRGVGTCMMQVVENDLLRRGFKQLTLNVSQENKLGREFYEHSGYRVVDSDPGRWSYVDDRGLRVDVHEPAWRMIKNLVLVYVEDLNI